MVKLCHVGQWDCVPPQLKCDQQWVCWRYADLTNKGIHRLCKLPVSAVTGRPAKTNCPITWTSFEKALAYFSSHENDLDGIGFVFAAGDPWVGIDLDDCREPTTGELSSRANDIVSELATYTEVSPSGTGVKCIASCSEILRSYRRSEIGLEVYHQDRYFTITGDMLPGYSSISDRTAEVLALQKRFARPAIVAGQMRRSSVTSADSEISSDSEVLARARNAKNGEKFRLLWNGTLADNASSHSEADLSLCRILAFWCGPNPVQIDRLFQQSKLFRPKWDERHFADGATYGEATIARAIEAQDGTFFRPGYRPIR